jgi:hypothetical protein
MRVPDDDLPSSFPAPKATKSVAVPMDDMPDFAVAAPKRAAAAVPADDIPLEPRLAREAKAPTTIEGIRAQANMYRQQYGVDTGLAPSTMAPVESKGGAAFGVYAIQGKQRQQNIEQRKAEQKAREIPFEQIVKNDELFNMANSYMKAVGQKTFDAEKETREDFVNRFYSNRRFAEFNTVFGTIPELLALKNSGADVAQAIAVGRDLYEKAGDAPGQWRAAWDIAKSIISDPVTYVGPAAGKVVSSTVVRQGGKKLVTEPLNRRLEKEALSRVAKRAEVGASTAVEMAAGAAADITSQRAEQETARALGEEVPEFDAWRTVRGAMLTGVISGAVSAKATKAPTIKEKGEIIGEELVRRNVTTANPSAPLTPTEQNIAAAMTRDFDQVHSEYVKSYGKSLLEQVDPATAVTDSKVQEAYSKTAVRMALQLMKDSPDQFGFNPAKEQISDAVYRTLSELDKFDNAALESAVNKVGLTPDQFAAMTKTTASEAGKILQSYSVASRALNRMREIDPGFNKRMEELYGVDNDQVGALTKFGQAVQRVERESKAIITSGIDTLARNIVGNTIGVSLKTGVQMVEGIRYSVGTALSAADGQKLTVLRQTMGDAFKDAIGTFYYMRKTGLAEDITEKVLENNPSLLSRISTATQDTEMDNVSKLARWSQTLNNAMDGMYRRASFVASLDQELRRVGVDLYKDVLSQNKDIPTSVLKKALDNSFKDTFSYTPQIYAKSFSAFEDSFEKIGGQFVRVAEAPGMSLAIPFPRFITNAIAFQYKYSPLGFIGATEYATQAAKLRAAGQLEKAEMVAREGATKAIQATVGLGALAAAYEYRKNNLDTNWNEVKADGGVVDVKSIFPLAPYLGLADWLARDVAGGTGNAPAKDIIENIVGFKTPAGTQHSFLQTLTELTQSDESGKAFLEGLGKIAGDFMGRFTQPFVTKQIFDMFDLIRGDEAVMARDPNVLTADTAGERMVEAAQQRVQAKLPVVKESLPPAVVRFEEQQTPSKEGEFFNRLVGFRTIPNRTEAEKEIIKHSTDLYKRYGRPSGDKDFDRLFIENTNKFAIDFVNEVITRPDYKQGLSEEKKVMIDNAISKAVEIAKARTEGQFAQDFPEKLSRIEYMRLSAEKKKIVNQRYARDHGGRTMEEDKAYDKLPEYSDFGGQQFAVGGVVQQMNRLFGK